MTRRIILAGGGHAHLAVLADWAQRPFPETERWLVTSTRQTAYSGMLPGWLAGIYPAGELLIDLEPLARQAGARLILSDVTGLDAAARQLTLASGETLAFDLLSLATGGEIDTATFAALGDRLLPVRPVGAFMARWTHFLTAIAGSDAPRVVVVGGGAAGVELALAVATALARQFRQPQVALVTVERGFLAGHASAVRQRALAELAGRGVALHYGEAVGTRHGVLLTNGTGLAADCVIAATGSRAPRWLAASGLACNDQGFVAVGADLRSISHDAIFAAGDIINRADRPLERSGVHAVKAGPVLAANLRAAARAAPLKAYQPRGRTLYLLATGDRRAIGSWGGLMAAGRWVWWIKDWIDRHFVGRYTRPGEGGR
ncbi:FAD-dependent oxidoreductase [Novosphingobium sp.]|uniref:FAD-dependent oxidoreductase n=1 Tax=Novosphingobium sp. TaxID=1874826 RepID=UPI002735CAF5|nr:FAD-dependent oxidoreductase [Novosphingobium sp.]MDP3907927.1 FAD-dependent oxidoreductase [Novosphingobium sp.]